MTSIFIYTTQQHVYFSQRDIEQAYLIQCINLISQGLCNNSICIISIKLKHTYSILQKHIEKIIILDNPVHSIRTTFIKCALYSV